VDSAAVDHGAVHRWPDLAALDRLGVASTAAVLPAARAAIRMARTVEATDAQVTRTAATSDLLTVAVAMDLPALATAIAATTELTGATTAQLVRAGLTARAIFLLGRVVLSEIRTETRTEIRDTGVVVMERLRIAAIPE
jgi:hypothetical protein